MDNQAKLDQAINLRSKMSPELREETYGPEGKTCLYNWLVCLDKKTIFKAIANRCH